MKSRKAALEKRPTDLRLAWRYWRALGAVRDGGYVVRVFGPAALAGPTGAAALARAYVELHASSGESPRLGYVYVELRQALMRALPVLSGDDRRAVSWTLSCLGFSREDQENMSRQDAPPTTPSENKPLS